MAIFLITTRPMAVPVTNVLPYLRESGTCAKRSYSEMYLCLCAVETSAPVP